VIEFYQFLLLLLNNVNVRELACSFRVSFSPLFSSLMYSYVGCSIRKAVMVIY
jgi:hypothetical protein